MTALCGGGTSGPKSGIGSNVVFDAALISTALTLIEPLLAPLATLIEQFSYQVAASCATDPPPMPSSADLNPLNAIGGVLNPNFGAWLTAVDNLLLNYAWSQFCQCTSGPQPTFTYPPPPSGETQVQGTSATPCYSATWTGTPWDGTANPPLTNDIPLLIPAGVSTLCQGTIPCIFVNAPVPISYSGTIQATGSSGNTVETLYVCQYTSSGAIVGCSTYNVTVTAGVGSGTFSGTVGTTTSRIYVSLLIGPGHTYIAVPSSVSINWTCSAPPASCCTDSTTANTLSEIYQLLAEVYSLMPARVPNYAAATSHAGLTGTGTLALASTTIALKVSITTFPTVYGSIAGLPTTYIDVGWLSPVTNQGAEAGMRLSRSIQVFPLPEATSSIDYSLEPGEVVTIQELQAG